MTDTNTANTAHFFVQAMIVVLTHNMKSERLS